ncbi:hypothetical protein ACH5RR_038855 [Cinchona calisaya]|uniref:Uncharacterized protein n=1 Tax=Cinchona calisaya TaxID=153742 RepID=A0ABD2XZU6_9GENT
MLKTETGTILASNILSEICDLYQPLISTILFSLILNSCVRFGSYLKGEQIIGLMAQFGVLADVHTIVYCHIVQIHKMNCMRDELKRYKKFVFAVVGSSMIVC